METQQPRRSRDAAEEEAGKKTERDSITPDKTTKTRLSPEVEKSKIRHSVTPGSDEGIRKRAAEKEEEDVVADRRTKLKIPVKESAEVSAEGLRSSAISDESNIVNDGKCSRSSSNSCNSVNNSNRSTPSAIPSTPTETTTPPNGRRIVELVTSGLDVEDVTFHGGVGVGLSSGNGSSNTSPSSSLASGARTGVRTGARSANSVRRHRGVVSNSNSTTPRRRLISLAASSASASNNHSSRNSHCKRAVRQALRQQVRKRRKEKEEEEEETRGDAAGEEAEGNSAKEKGEHVVLGIFVS